MVRDLVILPRSNLSTTSFAIGIPIGGAYESIPGISTIYTSHLMRNTDKRNESELANYMDSNGIATFSNVGKTSFSLGLNCPPQKLEVAQELFKEMLLEPQFDENITRKLVQQQKGLIQHTESTPQQKLLGTTRWQAAFGESKISKNPQGTEEGLGDVNVEALHRFHEQVLRMDPSFCSVGIDIKQSDFETTNSTLSVYGTERIQTELRDQYVPELNVQSDKLKMTMANVYIGINLTSIGNNQSRYEDVILNSILSGGMSSRLFTEIREKRNLSYAPFSTNNKFSEFGLMTMAMEVIPEKIEVALQVTLDLVDDILKSDIPADEMKRAVKIAQRAGVFVSDSSQRYAGWLIGRLMAGREWDLVKDNEMIQAASELDWQETMLKYWKKENLTLGIVGMVDEIENIWQEQVEKVM